MLDEATADRLIGLHLRRLEILRRQPPSAVITCEICGGGAPEPEFCGCGGTSTVAEAIRHHEIEIEILEK